eukprot:4044123-Heterocapsa_arctica.AAC.1
MDELLAIYFQLPRPEGQEALDRKGQRQGKGKPVKKTGPCRDCQAHGHWSGNPERPKVQDGTVPPFKPKPQPPAHGVRFAGFAGGGGEQPEVHLYEQPSSSAAARHR